jgi:hypothetical protein
LSMRQLMRSFVASSMTRFIRGMRWARWETCVACQRTWPATRATND